MMNNRAQHEINAVLDRFEKFEVEQAKLNESLDHQIKETNDNAHNLADKNREQFTDEQQASTIMLSNRLDLLEPESVAFKYAGIIDDTVRILDALGVKVEANHEALKLSIHESFDELKVLLNKKASTKTQDRLREAMLEQIGITEKNLNGKLVNLELRHQNLRETVREGERYSTKAFERHMRLINRKWFWQFWKKG